jgi:hypothetical protein
MFNYVNYLDENGKNRRKFNESSNKYIKRILLILDEMRIKLCTKYLIIEGFTKTIYVKN